MPDPFLTSPPDERRLAHSLASAVGNVWLMLVPTTRQGDATPAVVLSIAGFRGYTQTPRDVDVVMLPGDARAMAEAIVEVLDRNEL